MNHCVIRHYSVKRLLLVSLLLGVGLPFAPSAALAEVSLEPPEIVLAVKRPSLFARLIQGDARLHRTVSLRTEQKLEQLSAMSQDLLQKEGGSVLPADGITVELSQTELADAGTVQIPLEIDLGKLEASGSYEGAVLLSYVGGQQRLPIRLTVKDAAWGPWLVMLAGVGLGLRVTLYRREGQQRDKIIVAVGRLRTQLRAEPELTTEAQRFGQAVESHLVDVETALFGQDWATASQAVVDAQKLWNRWRKGKLDWVAQLKFLGKLEQTVEGFGIEASPYGITLLNSLADLERKLATFETPQALREQLSELQLQVARYQMGESMLNDFEALQRGLNDRNSPWRDEKATLTQSLQAMSSDDETGFKQWREEVQQKQQALQQAVREQAESESEGEPALLIQPRGVASGSSTWLTAAPEIATAWSEREVGQASNRLRVFGWVCNGVAWVMLSGVGMAQLYEGNPTFGALPVTSYFTLFAWGFGAEASRQSVVKALRGAGAAVGGIEPEEE